VGVVYVTEWGVHVCDGQGIMYADPWKAWNMIIKEICGMWCVC
jgi:hypothetical protein